VRRLPLASDREGPVHRDSDGRGGYAPPWSSGPRCTTYASRTVRTGPPASLGNFVAGANSRRKVGSGIERCGAYHHGTSGRSWEGLSETGSVTDRFVVAVPPGALHTDDDHARDRRAESSELLGRAVRLRTRNAPTLGCQQ
jgi:hypothetical protein